MSSSVAECPPLRFDRMVGETALAKRLKLDRCTLWRLRKRKRNALPYLKIGGRIMYDPIQVDAWIGRCAVNSR